MLDKEFKYYLDNQKKLVKKHNKKFVVIKDEKVIGVYDSEVQAYFETKKNHEPGTFLIQFCEPGEGSYTHTYQTRVTFV